MEVEVELKVKLKLRQGAGFPPFEKGGLGGISLSYPPSHNFIYHSQHRIRFQQNLPVIKPQYTQTQS